VLESEGGSLQSPGKVPVNEESRLRYPGMSSGGHDWSFAAVPEPSVPVLKIVLDRAQAHILVAQRVS